MKDRPQRLVSWANPAMAVSRRKLTAMMSGAVMPWLPHGLLDARSTP